jgi:hypothetical protein
VIVSGLENRDRLQRRTLIGFAGIRILSHRQRTGCGIRARLHGGSLLRQLYGQVHVARSVDGNSGEIA